MDFDISILRCPVTGEDLSYVSSEDAELLFRKAGVIKNRTSLPGLVNLSKTLFYPVADDIPVLLRDHALPLGEKTDKVSGNRNSENQRVFNYYNEIDFECVNNIERYKDAAKWLDFREVSHDYISGSLLRAKRHLGNGGKYLLDIASGPIGSDEYLSLSENFGKRICIDVSLNALRMARKNLGREKGIYICGDIREIPLKPGLCDSVLCQHTLFHIHRQDQLVALDELSRTTKVNGKIVIVYNLFYRSLFMNIAIFPIQLYRIARHLAGKIHARVFKVKSHLYFYAHSLAWFKRWAGNDRQIEVFSWRSVNKYFLNLYIHKNLWGKSLLKALSGSEISHPAFWGNIGEYPVIVITKLTDEAKDSNGN